MTQKFSFQTSSPAGISGKPFAESSIGPTKGSAKVISIYVRCPAAIDVRNFPLTILPEEVVLTARSTSSLSPAAATAISTSPPTTGVKNIVRVRLSPFADIADRTSSTHVTVIGITDRSFAQPYILLSAIVPENGGYFGERLKAARSELVQAWKGKSSRLEPRFASTDIVGALLLASQLFNREGFTADERVLVLLSDMRHHTRDLDLESVSTLSSLVKSEDFPRPESADLHWVQVYILGVDGSSKSTTYWRSLNRFWKGYIQRSGGNLKVFTVLREMPPSDLARSSAESTLKK